MTDASEPPQDVETEEHESGLVVVQADEDDDDEQEVERSEIDRPDKLMRLAGTVQGLLNEVRASELDDAGRRRLAQVHRRVLAELETVVSDDLIAELEAMKVDGIQPDATAGELRVAQAQLAGWLEGLFHGIRASVANQQAALLQQVRQQQAGQGPAQQGTSQPGQYL